VIQTKTQRLWLKTPFCIFLANLAFPWLFLALFSLFFSSRNCHNFRVHDHADPILETLSHIPELARMRQKKQENEEKKIRLFQKTTHVILRKQNEQMERHAMAHRHAEQRLQDEQRDASNLHRHLHLHHNQTHGLADQSTAGVAESANTLLKSAATDTVGASSFMIFLVIFLAIIAVVLVVVVIVTTVKAVKAKTENKDYH
jgi:hypothetical protein